MTTIKVQIVIKELNDIVNKLNRCKIDESYEVKSLGEKAINLIYSLRELNNTNLKNYIIESYENLDFTIKNEVEFFDSLKDNDSITKKRKYRNNAVSRLTGQIGAIVIILNSTEITD